MSVLITTPNTEDQESTPKTLSGSTTINVEGKSDGSEVEVWIKNPGDTDFSRTPDVLKSVGAKNLTLTGSEFKIRLVRVGPDTAVIVTDTL